FQAASRLCQWLARHRDFGRPPAAVELLDTRELFWPPAGGRRRLWLFRFRYPAAEGVGLVGPAPQVLVGETNPSMSAEDVYALYCCRELQALGDPRAP